MILPFLKGSFVLLQRMIAIINIINLIILLHDLLKNAFSYLQKGSLRFFEIVHQALIIVACRKSRKRRSSSISINLYFLG